MKTIRYEVFCNVNEETFATFDSQTLAIEFIEKCKLDDVSIYRVKTTIEREEVASIQSRCFGGSLQIV